MIDDGKMLESVERLERVFGGETRATQSIGEVKELLVRLRKAEKDAARWRVISESPDSSITLRIHNSRCDQRDYVMDEYMQRSGYNK